MLAKGSRLIKKLSLVAVLQLTSYAIDARLVRGQSEKFIFPSFLKANMRSQVGAGQKRFRYLIL